MVLQILDSRALSTINLASENQTKKDEDREPEEGVAMVERADKARMQSKSIKYPNPSLGA